MPILEQLQSAWEDLASDIRFEEVKSGLESGLENMRKWYRKSDKSNAYFISLGQYVNSNSLCSKCTLSLASPCEDAVF